MKKRISILFSLALLAALLLTVPVHAQQSALTLRLRKVFGYNGFDGKIQGTFKLSAEGPTQLQSVTFYVDGQPLGSVAQPPFELQFSTEGYPPGIHSFSAEGRLDDGDVVASETLRAEIITAAESRRAALRIVVPILLLSFGAVVLGGLFPLLSGRRKSTQPVGSYSLAGGAICPKCGLPFSRHVLAPNLLTGKLERCPHCGKWSVVARAAPERLAAAEARLRAEQQAPATQPAEDGQDQLRQRLDQTKFED